MRYLIALLLFVTPLQAQWIPGKQWDPPQVTGQVTQPTGPAAAASVRINFSGYWGGTGVCFHCEGGYGYVVSNFHVSPCSVRDIKVQFPGGPLLDAECMGSDPDHDVSILRVKGDRLPTVQLSRASVVVGTHVRQMGYPGVDPSGRPRKVRVLEARVGRVTKYEESSFEWEGVKRKGTFGQASFRVRPGDSGSGVFDATGLLVGVVWGGNNDGAAFVRAEDVCALWDGIRNRKPPQPPAQPQPSQQDPRITTIAGRIEDLHAKLGGLDELKKMLADLQAKGDGSGLQLANLQEFIRQMHGKSVADVLSGMPKLDLSRLEATLPLLQKGIEDARAAGLLSADKADIAAKAAAAIGAVAGGGGLTAVLTAVGGPAGLAAGLVAIGIAVYRRKQGAGAHPNANGSHVDLTALLRAVPQDVVSRYVPVLTQNPELAALKDMMDLYAQRNPGAVPAIETIKSWTGQKLSGQQVP